jgi:multidrug efflux pump subunit AcrA (membrane-fusion protein)
MRSSRIMIPAVVIVGLAAVVGVVFSVRSSDPGQAFVLSGTIEATEIHLASQINGLVKNVYAKEGDNVHVDQNLIDIYRSIDNANDKIKSPIDGTVLERLIEPGELAGAGVTLMVVANLDDLTLKVYVPEDRYGQITLGQTYSVTVDSFPGQSFPGKVSHIADKAEFTPRNVQTTDSRKSTVFAITLELAPTGGKLKPGMPADVHFAQ